MPALRVPALQHPCLPEIRQAAGADRLWAQKRGAPGLRRRCDRFAMTRRLVSLVLLIAAIAVVHTTLVAPWFMRWGATDRELAAVWPGDELSVSAGTVSMRAVTVHAPPEAIWPWIAQLGQDRAGWYSYRLLENIVG